MGLAGLGASATGKGLVVCGYLLFPPVASLFHGSFTKVHKRGNALEALKLVLTREDGLGDRH